MNKALIASSAILGVSLIVGMNFENFESYFYQASTTTKNLFETTDDYQPSPYSELREAIEKGKEQEVIGKAWETFLVENKNGSSIKLIRNKEWGDYMCYSLDGTSEKEDDKHSDLFVDYLIRHEVLNKKDWSYEDLSSNRMRSVHPYGGYGRTNSFHDMNPAMVKCRQPISLYRVNRYKRTLQ